MTGIAHFSWVVTALSMFTWFKVSPTALDDLATFKDLEAVKDGKSKQTESQTEDVTSAGGHTDGGYNKVSALELGVVQERQEV
jgi:hypothetical protein